MLALANVDSDVHHRHGIISQTPSVVGIPAHQGSSSTTEATREGGTTTVTIAAGTAQLPLWYVSNGRVTAQESFLR